MSTFRKFLWKVIDYTWTIELARSKFRKYIFRKSV